jgi:predicted nucleic acid-binding protein
LAPLIASLPEPNATQARYASDLFKRLEIENKFGLITPTVYSELMHLAIKLHYQRLGAARGLKHGGWLRLYKADPSFIQTLQPNLEELRFLLSTNRITFLSPDDLGPINPNTTFDYRLIELCWTYSLDTQDAGILFEAERLGVDNIVTMDSDLQRAQSGFNIYTWL